MTAHDAGRVIAGTARGIRIEAPGQGTRPLTDRVKQTLFAILEPDLPGANVLDLFAGSGAAGLEALSRGAAHVTFIEHDRAAAAVIATNLARTHLAGTRARIVRADVLGWLAGPDRAGRPLRSRDRGPAVCRGATCWSPRWARSSRTFSRADESWPSMPGARSRRRRSAC